MNGFVFSDSMTDRFVRVFTETILIPVNCGVTHWSSAIMDIQLNDVTSTPMLYALLAFELFTGGERLSLLGKKDIQYCVTIPLHVHLNQQGLTFISTALGPCIYSFASSMIHQYSEF
ncbi:hypothetical protein GQ600_25201 [Phytophthora cactorum]|nr:hypothetical protein GQ600_25201 [Phytophthora cactorum]